MSVLQRLRERLDAVERNLTDRPQLASEIRAVRQILADPARQWVGTVEAQRLLGVQSVNTVKTWARLGILRSRRLPNGRLQLHLDDLLRERAAIETQATFPDDAPVTEEERRLARVDHSPELEEQLAAMADQVDPDLARILGKQ